jgi:flavin reductase (DIM6/NTAB) family NADH-FMN oxidoreductase RutF
MGAGAPGYGTTVPDADDPFERIVSALDVPCFVVTVAAGEQSGCLVGFTTQCSIDPPRFLVCVSRANHTFPLVERAGVVAVHALHAGDEAAARLFGEETGDEVDKLARCSWSPGPDGVPVVDGLDWFLGRVLDRFDLGDHVGVLLAPVPAMGRAERVAAATLGTAALRDLDAGHAA